MEKVDVVRHILRHVAHGQFVNSAGHGWAPSNVALCKYWGKRDTELNLPVTSSLSVTLGNHGAFTTIKHTEKSDSYVINGKLIGAETQFALRLKKFLNLFRPRNIHYNVVVETNVPIAAGFASSACGFASLVRALDKLYDWRLAQEDLSILARLGSGSACRSLARGFVEWQRGERDDGMDSYGVLLEITWPELRVGLLTISTQAKTISSREAMQLTVETVPQYAVWSKQVAADLEALKLALTRKDFVTFGAIAENSASSMHELMLNATPLINYSLPETIQAKEQVYALRANGIPIFFTQDAGPNLQLLFLVEHEASVLDVFSDIDIVLPFADSNVEQLVLVNQDDVEIGIGEKLAVHMQGKLHRAFSVMVLRERGGEFEVLLQMRSSNKYHSANLWSNTCCGHPKMGENVVEAAKKRLREEMGFGVALTEIGKFHYFAEFPGVNLSENELDHVLIGFSDIEEIVFDPNEVQDCCWMSFTTLQQELMLYPDRYTAWLPEVVNCLGTHLR